MTENEKYLKDAQQKIAEFKTENEPERLRDAAISLDNVILAKESEKEVRQKLRTDSLNLWLTLLKILDDKTDPDFDIKDVPPKSVQPPVTSKGVMYPPGASPDKIDDPKARAEYEKAIAENRAKQENFRLQIQIKELNDFIPPRAENFIKSSYTDSDEDQKEVREAIDKTIENEDRKTRLMTMIKAEKTPS